MVLSKKCRVRKARLPTEDQDHKALVRIFRRAGLFFEHPPLGGMRSNAAGREMKLLGAVAGSPDFRIYDIPPRFPAACGVAFELKRQGRPYSAVSGPQIRFLVKLGTRGWVVGWGDREESLAWLRWLGYQL